MRGRLANLWYAATKALGFDVTSIRCPDPLFLGSIKGLGVRAKILALLLQRLQWPCSLPDVVFLDVASILLGSDAVKYWGTWTTPHLFYCFGSDNSVALGGSAHHPSGNTLITPPPGWAARLVCLAHHERGGATLGRWTFTIWYPPHVPCVEPIAWIPRGGTPLLCCVNDWVWAAPYLGQRRSGIAGEQVVHKGGFVLDFGLFLASKPTAQVLVKSLGSPSGYGSCCLSARELGDLWDMPILLLDSLSDTEVTSLMEGICQSPPPKLLLIGADLLLMASFWGDFGALSSKGSSRALASDKLSARWALPGPCPLTDDELGLCPLPAGGVGASGPEKLAQGLAQELDHELAQGLVLPQDSPEDAVIKGDHQKANNAAVPDRLWLRAFAIGYRDTAYPVRHLEALNLPPTSQVGFLGEPKPPAGWRGALPGLRLFALRHWRSRMTRDYISWRRENVPIVGCGKGTGPLVQYHWERRSGAEPPVYEWASCQDSGLSERRLYKSEWMSMQALTEGAATVEAGYDAIHRCADASWFEWCKGSAPSSGIGGRNISVK